MLSDAENVDIKENWGVIRKERRKDGRILTLHSFIQDAFIKHLLCVNLDVENVK